MEPNLLQNLLANLKLYRLKYIKASFILLLSNLFLILNPLVLRQAIGKELFYWVILLLVIAFVGAFLKYKMRIAFVSISRDVERDVRSRLFSRLQSQSQAFYDRYEVGELLSRLTNDVTIYRNILGPGIMYPLLFITIVIPGLIVLFTLSPHLALLSLIPVFMIPLLNISFRHWIYRLSKSVQESLGKISTLAQEHYSSIRLIRSYVVEGPMGRGFSRLSHQLNRYNFDLMTLQSLMFPFYGLITRIITTSLVFFTGWIFLKGWQTLTPADFVSFMWIQSYIFVPVMMMAWMLPIYQRGKAAYDRLLEIYEAPIEVEDRGDQLLRIPPNANIEIRNLTFTYPEGESPVLKEINCTFEPGTFIGITGRVGSGKTTLFRLLNREYEVPSGTIFIGGRDIHDYPLSAFSESVVAVEQVPFLFSRTIAENVSFGKPEASLDQVEEVALDADLHETVLEFPETYETIVGERGVTLSGGQKQRVAMARAFLVNRSILLLDNVFSAIDLETEKTIFEKMRQNFSGKTVLLVTERTSILNQMDHIFYFSDGEIKEQGAPEELIQKEGCYAALNELQR